MTTRKTVNHPELAKIVFISFEPVLVEPLRAVEAYSYEGSKTIFVHMIFVEFARTYRVEHPDRAFGEIMTMVLADRIPHVYPGLMDEARWHVEDFAAYKGKS